MAVILARGGSHDAPPASLYTLAGQSLVARAIATAQATHGVDDVVVSTDHARVAREAERVGATVVDHLATTPDDETVSDPALIDAVEQYEKCHGTRIDITVLIQCSSPFIDPRSLENAIARVESGVADVVFSAVADHRPVWTLNNERRAAPVDNSAHEREHPTTHVNETGAFYVMRTSGLREHNHHFFGRVEVEEVPAQDAWTVQSLSDLAVARTLAGHRFETVRLDIDALVTDFDGVHTDDAVHVDENGVESVRVHRGDGMGVGRLVKAGFPFLILSKERNPVVTRRAEKLRVEVAQGIDNKAQVISEWMAHKGLDPKRVAYVGNDINDVEAFRVVGWPIAVADAHPHVIAEAKLVLKKNGGHGAVREVCDLVNLSSIAQ